jgi:hypothetical protein
MEMIRPNIWLGSYSTILHAPDYVRHCGISLILNVALEVNYNFPIHQIKFPMRDGWEREFSYPAFQRETHRVMANLDHAIVSQHTVLVHCAEGRSRSPHVIAMYLTYKETAGSFCRRTYEKYWTEIASYRTEVHRESFLARYREKFPFDFLYRKIQTG